VCSTSVPKFEKMPNNMQHALSFNGRSTASHSFSEKKHLALFKACMKAKAKMTINTTTIKV